MRSDVRRHARWKLAVVVALAGWMSAAGAALAAARAATPPARIAPAAGEARPNKTGAGEAGAHKTGASAELGACAVLPGALFAFASPRGVVLTRPTGEVQGVVGLAQGMPGAGVADLALGPDGLWAATEGGLVELRPAPPAEPGASHAPGGLAWRVTRVVPTGSATAVTVNDAWVYVGVRDRGVVRVDRRSLDLKALPFAARARGLARTGRARITALDTDGECDGADLLVGTAGGGVYRDVDEALVLDTRFPRNTWAWSVHSAATGSTVAGVAGLLRQGARGRVPNPPPELRTETQERGLGQGGFGPLSRRDLRVVTRDAQGRLVAAGAHGALFFVNAKGRLTRAGKLPGGEDEVVTSLRFGGGAASGAACAASAGAAWVRPAGGAWRRVRQPVRPPADLSAVALGPDGAVWVSGFRGGLWSYSGGRWRRVAAGRVDPWVNGLAVEGDGTAWAATARGLFRVAVSGAVRRFGVDDGLPSENLHTVLALRGGGVAVGGTRGLARVQGEQVIPVGVKQGLRARGVWALAERPAAAGGGLVVGTTDGVWVEASTGRWARLSVASGHLADDFVTALALSGDGRTLWAGTYQGGVARVGLTTWEATQLGGGRVNVAGLVLVPGRTAGDTPTLLAATMGGLLRRAAGGGGAWAAVSGPPGLDVTGAALAGDALWVSTRRGVGRLTRASVMPAHGRR